MRLGKRENKLGGVEVKGPPTEGRGIFTFHLPSPVEKTLDPPNLAGGPGRIVKTTGVIRCLGEPRKFYTRQYV